jgi:ketopantoate reductase
MTDRTKLNDQELAAAQRRLAEFKAIAAVEGISFDDEDEEIFAMFDRERWSHQQCIEYLKARALAAAAE